MPMINPFVQRIPADVKDKTAGLKLDIPVGPETVQYEITGAAQAVRLSLRTNDPRERKAREAKVLAYLESVWAALRRNHLVPLSHRNAVALARDLYVAWAEEQEQTTAADWDRQYVDGKLVTTKHGAPDLSIPLMGQGAWESVEALVQGLADSPEQLDAMIDARLLKKGIIGVDPETRSMLGREFLNAMRDGIAVRARQAAGDYTPDPKANRFPAYEEPNGIPRPASGVSLTGLVELWWKEAKTAGRAPATYDSYKTTFMHFGTFLKHDDAMRVSPSDVVNFKGHRLAEGVSPATVQLNIAGIRAIYKWAMGEHLVNFNPALEIKVVKPKLVKLRDKSFTDDEVAMILKHATAVRQDVAHSIAKRWVPFLCAYTGARVGEMVQLRREDIREEAGQWLLTISPEAGTVKDKEKREVVIHQHLVDLGFVEFAKGCNRHHLFMADSNDIRSAIKAVKTALVIFVREVLTDPNVSPNHGWRHTFKTRGREAGIADSVLDAICGHAPQTVGGAYGHVTRKAQADAMEKFPKFTWEE